MERLSKDYSLKIPPVPLKPLIYNSVSAFHSIVYDITQTVFTEKD